jgi:hypothetical protein
MDKLANFVFGILIQGAHMGVQAKIERADSLQQRLVGHIELSRQLIHSFLGLCHPSPFVGIWNMVLEITI